MRELIAVGALGAAVVAGIVGAFLTFSVGVALMVGAGILALVAILVGWQ